MKKLPLLFCLTLFLAGFSSAQTNQNANCPTVEVSGGGIVEPGSPMSFTVNVKDYDLSKISFNWTTSAGEISKGQGTVTIAVTDYKMGENVTATVEVKGLPEGCPNTASETGGSPYCPPSPRLLDEFGNFPSGEIKARIDAYFIALVNEPNAQGYLINYGTDKEISRREALLKRYITQRQYEARRLTFVRGGANPNVIRGAWTRFWIVPPGAVPPTPEDSQ